MQQLVIGRVLADDEIGWRIVVPVSVHMMHLRACRQWLTHRPFNNQDMRWDSTMRRGAMMPWLVSHEIGARVFIVLPPIVT